MGRGQNQLAHPLGKENLGPPTFTKLNQLFPNVSQLNESLGLEAGARRLTGPGVPGVQLLVRPRQKCRALGVETQATRKISSGECLSAIKAGGAQISSSEIGKVQLTAQEAGAHTGRPSQNSETQLSTDQANAIQQRTTEVCSAQICPHQVAATQIQAAQVRTVQKSAVQLGARTNGSRRAVVKAFREAREHVKTRQTQVSTIEVTGAEISATQIDPAECRSSKINSSEVQPTPIGTSTIQGRPRGNRWQQVFRRLPLQKV
jgi:hypothetical protein